MIKARAWTRGRTTLKTFTTTLAAVALGAFGFLGAAQAQDKGTVGVAMPTKSSARWIDDGNNMVKVLKEKGYNVDLQYAEDDIPNQLSRCSRLPTRASR
jgi:putative multiple sugar transport system substrate-binding protein